MSTWKRLVDGTYTLGSKQRWWLWYLPVAFVGSLVQTFAQPWNWFALTPLVIFAFLLFDGHARWQRDDVRWRTGHAEFAVQPEWKRTGNAYFPTAAQVDGHWWVLRINNFPDHPLWTFFVDGNRRFDVDDEPPAWGKPADRELPALTPEEAQVALSPVASLVAYGSEVGRPCDNPYCCG